MMIPNLGEDRIPGFSQIRATREQRAQVIELLESSTALKATLSREAPISAFLGPGEILDAYVFQNNAPPLLLLYRLSSSAPYVVARELKEDLALEILSIVAPLGTAPLERWVIVWPPERRADAELEDEDDDDDETYSETLSFYLLG